MIAPRRRRLWPVPLLILAGCLIHIRELLGDRLYWRDTHVMYVPMKHYLAESIRRGELPQWWPYDGGGSPFLAQPMVSFFHPTTLAYLVLPFWQAFAFQDLAGTLLAVTGAYVLARSLRQSRLASFIPAVVYGANGYVVGLTEHTFMKLSAGTMPWYVWALLVAERRGGAWRIAPPLAMGLLLLGGDPQIALLASFAGLALLTGVRGIRWRTVLPALLAPLLGAALAAVQLAPTLGIVAETERRAAMTEADRWPFQLKHLAGLVLPIDHGPLEFSRSTTLGLAAIVLVFASLALPRRRPVAALWGVLLVALWLSLGDAFGLNLLARRAVPFWAEFRYPIKTTVLTMLAAALLAGEGFHALARPSMRRRALLWGGLGATALLVFAVLEAPALPPIATMSGAAVAAVAVLAFGHRSGWPRVLSVALLAASMIATAILTLRTTAPSFYDPPPLVGVLQRAGVGLTGPGFERMDERQYPPEALPYVDVAAVGGKSNDLGALYHLPDFSYYAPGASMRLRSFFGGEMLGVESAARVDGIFGIGFLVVARDLVKDSSLPILGEDDRFGYVVIPTRRALPRAYGVRRALPVADVNTAASLIKAGQLKPGREILVEGAVDPAWSERPDELAVPLRFLHRTANSVTLDADLPWSGFAVLNETAYTGWHVTVDGSPRPSLVANGLVRAVEVPQGRHRIEWRYRAPGLWLGAAISAAMLLAMVVFAWAVRPSWRASPIGMAGATERKR